MYNYNNPTPTSEIPFGFVNHAFQATTNRRDENRHRSIVADPLHCKLVRIDGSEAEINETIATGINNSMPAQVSHKAHGKLKTTTTDITSGIPTVTVIRKTKLPDGAVKVEAEITITLITGEMTEFSVNVNDIYAKKIETELTKHGLLVYSGCYGDVHTFLLESLKNAAVINETAGFYVEDGLLKNNRAEDIFRNAASKDELSALLGLSEKAGWFKLLLVSLACFFKLFRVVDFKEIIPVTFLKSAVSGEVVKKLSELFEEEAVPAEKLGKYAADGHEITLVDLGSASDYIQKKAAETIAGKYSYEDHPIFAVGNSAECLIEKIGEDRVVSISAAADFDAKSLGKARDWFFAECLKNPSVINSTINSEITYDGIELSDDTAPFISTLMRISLYIASAAEQGSDATDTATALTENLTLFLDNTALNAAEAVRSAIIDESIEVVPRSDFDIESGKEFAFYDGKHIYIMPKAIEKIANNNGVDYRAFISELKSADVLRIVEGKAQIPVTVNGRSVRAICIPIEKIFGFGEIGLNEERFVSEPEIKIEIGEADCKKLYFALKDKAGNENGHSYICGPSASGKSTFLIGVAKRASALGMNVISVGYEFSALKVGEVLTVTHDDLSSEKFWEMVLEPGAAYTLIPNNEITAENILLQLYTIKTKSETKNPTILIIDEVQTIDCTQTGVLAGFILRQGRKFGILAFLASQYLTAEDARNVDKALKQCATKIAFAPGREASVATMLGVAISDKEARRRLEEMERYSFAAKGALATENGFVRTAVIAKSPAV